MDCLHLSALGEDTVLYESPVSSLQSISPGCHLTVNSSAVSTPLCK